MGRHRQAPQRRRARCTDGPHDGAERRHAIRRRQLWIKGFSRTYGRPGAELQAAWIWVMSMHAGKAAGTCQWPAIEKEPLVPRVGCLTDTRMRWDRAFESGMNPGAHV